MTTPLQRYQRDLGRHGFQEDQAQRQAVQVLDQLFHELVQAEQVLSRNGVLGHWLGRWRRQPRELVQGLYLWGGVGRGKTWLVDSFHDCLPFKRKMRLHFHRFMHRVHSDLKRLQGRANPLLEIADTLAAETRVVCFDEFFVSDIADAMILGRLLEALFQRGVTLVATSNVAPDDLYRDGLQRQRFLPAIALLRENTRILPMEAGVDYRLRALEQAQLYHWPLDESARENLQQCFERLAPEPGKSWQLLEINGRKLKARCLADDVVWFEFNELCASPRSQNDYIELSRIYHAVLLGNVPQLGRDTDDQARRLVSLVDEFYDRNVKLVISAAAPLLDLYRGGGLNAEFERTISRLQEMQSHEYLARSHKP
ncbi:MAG: cell division protein ZapE [Halieaceae bacterium]|nr:cell division protein ZapE [Halieaceae bacterium]